MKSFLIKLATGAMITATVLSPLAEAQAAQPRRVVHETVREGPRGNVSVHRTTVVRKDYRNDYRSWRKGERFDRRYASRYTVINNPRAYRLYNAPRGYHWVRSGNDAVLVAITSGIIGAVIGNALR
ncbi:MAG: RcnB family protein [Sphingobium phenoxybenzoativorans]